MNERIALAEKACEIVDFATQCLIDGSAESAITALYVAETSNPYTARDIEYLIAFGAIQMALNDGFQGEEAMTEARRLLHHAR